MPSRSHRNSVSGFEKKVSTFSGGDSSIEYDTPSKVNWSDFVQFGDNVPGWREKLKSGVNATTTLSAMEHTARVIPGRIKATRSFGLVRASELTGLLGLGLVSPNTLLGSLDAVNADNLALGKFANKVANAEVAFQGGVFAGELGQTLQLFKSPVQGLRRLVDDWLGSARRIRAGQSGSVSTRIKRVTENLADAWLEAQFGWKPLYSDVKAAAEALSLYSKGTKASVKRITASHAAEDKPPESFSNYSETLSATWRNRVRRESSYTVIYRGAVRVEAKPPGELDLEQFGLNPGSFLPTAWELIPYSFLIDYFSNAGNIIYGMSTLFTRLAWCNKTTVLVHKTVGQTEFGSSPSNVSVSFVPSVSVGNTKSVARAPYNGTLVPGVAFKIPSLGSLKWLNIAALIASRKSDRSWTFD
jgi:hypothetical protein